MASDKVIERGFKVLKSVEIGPVCYRSPERALQSLTRL